MFLIYLQKNLPQQLQNASILSPTPKGYNASLIAPALLPLRTPIDDSFQLLNHPQKTPNFAPDPSTLLTAPSSTVTRHPSDVVATENSTAGYTEQQLKLIREMNSGFHYFGTTSKK